MAEEWTARPAIARLFGMNDPTAMWNRAALVCVVRAVARVLNILESVPDRPIVGDSDKFSPAASIIDVRMLHRQVEPLARVLDGCVEVLGGAAPRGIPTLPNPSSLSFPLQGAGKILAGLRAALHGRAALRGAGPIATTEWTVMSASLRQAEDAAIGELVRLGLDGEASRQVLDEAAAYDAEFFRELRLSTGWDDAAPTPAYLPGPLWPNGVPRNWPVVPAGSHDSGLIVEIEIPEHASDADVVALASEVAVEADELHRSLGGHGLQVAEVRRPVYGTATAGA